MDEALEYVTITAVATVLWYRTGIPSDVWSLIITVCWDEWEASTTFGQAMSVRITGYEHVNGPMINDFTRVEKMVISPFADDNFTVRLGEAQVWYKKWVYR